MTVREAIALVDEVKPNAFSTRVKVLWLAELDGRMASSVFRLAPEELGPFRYSEERDMDVELLVSPPYDGIYPLWLEAKIDFANGEYTKYANTMAAYNASYDDFLSWFLNQYKPAEGYAGEELRERYGLL